MRNTMALGYFGIVISKTCIFIVVMLGVYLFLMSWRYSLHGTEIVTSSSLKDFFPDLILDGELWYVARVYDKSTL